MATYLTPGIYVEEKKSAVQPIEAASTSVAAFIGVAQKGPINKATLVTSVAEFVDVFGGPISVVAGSQEHYLYYAARHFFTEGGTKCFVVRVSGYGDINDATTLRAVSAFKDFNAHALDGSLLTAALRISAATPGRWGETLGVRVESSSKFSVLLAENTVASASQLTLRDNQDIEVGSLLFVVDQVTASIQSIDVNTMTVQVLPGRTGESSTPADVNIPPNTQVFTPDMKLFTTTSAATVVKYDSSLVSIKLASFAKVNGESLKLGDIVNLVRPATTPALVTVKRFVEKLVSGERAMLVELDSALPATSFVAGQVKAYARDFDVVVAENDRVLEVHTHLSLIGTNKRDYVNERLAPSTNASRLITAQELTATGALSVDAAFNPNAPFMKLGGGNDGLGGSPAFGDKDIIGSDATATGLFALDTVKDASLLAIPNASVAVAKAATAYCERRKDLFLILDMPRTVSDPLTYVRQTLAIDSSYAAIYFPWIADEDPVTRKQILLPPSGAVAGTFAQTDISRGVHKAPAGVANGYLNSAMGIQTIVTKGQNDLYYQQRINVIRKYPEGILVWGARTLSSNPEWRYVNVRRLFIFLERSIERGLGWVVFEPNDYGLWKSIKRNVSAFLRVQWEESKLVGSTEQQAFFVRCDQTTNTPDTVSAGQVIAEIGVAPSKPAEFVVFRFKQFIGKSN